MIELKARQREARAALRGLQRAALQHLRQRPVLHQLHRKLLAQERLVPVHGGHHRGAQQRRLAILKLLHVHLVHQLARSRHALAPAPHRHVFIFAGLKAPAIAPQRHAQRRHIKRQRLHRALQHQRARHARVIFKVPAKKPQVRRDRLHRAQIAAPPRPALRFKIGDFIKKAHVARLDARRAAVRFGQLKARPKALGAAPLTEGAHLRSGEGAARGQRRIRQLARVAQRRRCFRGRIPDHAVRGSQLRICKEARLPVAHAQAHFAVHAQIRAEEKHADVAQLRMPVNVNVKLQRVARLGQRALDLRLAAQQPVHALAAVQRINAHPRNQQQVCLARLNCDAQRHVAFMQIPRIRQHIGLRPDGAGAQLARHGVNPGHAVRQQHGRHWHAHLALKAILPGKRCAKQRGDFAGSQLLQLRARELWPGTQRAWRRKGRDRWGQRMCRAIGRGRAPALLRCCLHKLRRRCAAAATRSNKCLHRQLRHVLCAALCLRRQRQRNFRRVTRAHAAQKGAMRTRHLFQE